MRKNKRKKKTSLKIEPKQINKILQVNESESKLKIFCRFITQNKAIAWFIGLISFLLAIYSLLQPDLRAIRGSLKVPIVQESALSTPDGIAIILEGTQLIQNKSLRAGGHVSDIKFIETSINTAIRPRAKLIELDQLPFTHLEKRLIKFKILAELGKFPEQYLPSLSFKIQFLDQNGATIRASDKDEAYTLTIEAKLSPVGYADRKEAHQSGNSLKTGKQAK
jgi:hypothetical protein